MKVNRDAILLEILREQTNCHLTVTSVRNEILQRDMTIQFDKANMRRWVNGKFKTLTRRGFLKKHVDEHGKAQYMVLDTEDELLSAVVLRSRHPSKQAATSSPYDSPADSFDQLKIELEAHRLKAISQLSEIEEYKRIKETFSDLRPLVELKFEAALNENCRILGKIRALEELLMSRETP